MATFRQIYISYWQDSYILDLKPEGKLLYMYFMTNSRTTQCGIYELPLKVIEFETGLDKETIKKYIQKFIEDKKILYSWGTNEIFLLNWLKYNPIEGPKILACVKKELANVKNKGYIRGFLQIANTLKYPIDELKNILDTPSIPLGYPLDTPCIGYFENEIEFEKQKIPHGEEEEKEKEEEKEIYKDIYIEDIEKENFENSRLNENKDNSITPSEVVELYNSICKSLPRVTTLTQGRKKKIQALLKRIRDRTEIETVFKKAEESDFLSGRSGKWKGCSFDWLVNYENFVRVLEGTYDNKGGEMQNGTDKGHDEEDNPYAGIGISL